MTADEYRPVPLEELLAELSPSERREVEEGADALYQAHLSFRSLHRRLGLLADASEAA